MTFPSSTTTMAAESAAIAPKLSRRTRKSMARTPKHLRANSTGYLMIAPLVILLAIFVIYPLVNAFYLSTYRTYYNKPAEFAGLDFYGYVLTDPEFWSSLRVSFVYSVIVVPTILVLALLLASFIKTLGARVAGFLKTTVYVPTVVSVVVASLLFVFIYQDAGFANWFVGLFGLDAVAWLNSPTAVHCPPSLSRASGWASVSRR